MASGWPSRGRPVTASPRCCRSSAASTGLPPARSSSTASTWVACRRRQVTKLRARSFGFIFQTFNLIPTLSAAENVEAALVPLGVSPRPRGRRAPRQALAAVGLGERLRHLPSELSGGQQQRVAIARALVKEPNVLLADEPTGNLDEGTRDEIIGLLEKLWRDTRADASVCHPRQLRGARASGSG